MSRNWHWKLASLALSGVLGASATACAVSHPAPVQAVTTLTVRNRSFFDVNVYVSTSVGGPAVRLGTVTSTSSATFPIRSFDLQSNGRLMLQVRAIGARDVWTSEAIAISPDLKAILEVSADQSGDCSRSSFYTMLGAVAAPQP